MSYTVKEHPNPKYFISWGLGLQSTTLGVLSCLGMIRRVDGIITADTGWEHSYTNQAKNYYLEFFEKHKIPVYTVSSGKNIQKNLHEDHTSLPLWTSKTGAPLRRQCTSFYKIYPIRRKIRELCGLRADNKGRTLRKTAIIYLGITIDEAERISISNREYIENQYPLIDLRWSRDDCTKFLNEQNLLIPDKSACVCCPYQGAGRWLYIKESFPLEFNDAIVFDEQIRTPPPRMLKRGYNFSCYLWKGLKSLLEEDFKSIVDKEDNKDICDSGYCFI